jgi:hypothetical protein
MNRSRQLLDKSRHNMKLIHWFTMPLLWVALGVTMMPTAGAAEEGVAIAIVYDTSGSMKEPVKNTAGQAAPKYVIANRALLAIASRIQTYATNGPAGEPRKIKAGLYVFQNNAPRVALPFGTFDPAALTTWVNGFSAPDGGTPLGTTLNTAANAVFGSGLTHQHVLVITDGMNTIGPNPDTILAKLQREADKKQILLGVHFVAFDVDDKVFAGVKKLGATVMSAADETQLNSQLEFILENKILLEAEEPPKTK